MCYALFLYRAPLRVWRIFCAKLVTNVQNVVLGALWIAILNSNGRFSLEAWYASASLSAVKNRILQLCGERNISVNRLASIIALSSSSVKNILYGKSQNPKLLTIKMLCDGLGITLGEFFSTPEFDALEQEIR